MKRWQIALIIVLVLGLLGGLELNIYFRHHHRAAKKIMAVPHKVQKAILKKSFQVKKAIVSFSRSTKHQYTAVAQKTTKLAAHKNKSGKAFIVAGAVLGFIAVGVGLWFLFVNSRTSRKPRLAVSKRKLEDAPLFNDDADLPPVTKTHDPEVNADRVAEVLKARRAAQNPAARREGKMSPLGGQQVKKYEFTEQEVNHEGRTLRRIRALVRLQNTDGVTIVEQGELGGYIEDDANLSHYRNAWVGEQAYVYGNAKIYGDAVVAGQAKVFDKARVYDLARVDGTTVIGGTAEVCGKAQVSRGTYAEGKIS